MDGKVVKELAEIIDLQIDDKSGLDLYLDTVTYMKDNKYLRYVKRGRLKDINYSDLIKVFLGYFQNGTMNFDYCHDSPNAGAAIVYVYYMEISKKGIRTADKLHFLSNLALNGLIKSKEYRLISNDKITGAKQKELEKNT